ncbi:dihydrolipoyl dehydrogenase [Saccharicrinis sp. FJH62]|uniref:dihydrolipoyl dehydrogenase n=1 Tax=Saccharicrinis sp. FJH62 TaxID=3344657 RepID=UPI0035D5262C
MYDLAIIGGGPAGYDAAERAGEKGLKVILFEKRELGGVCLNEGCIPTKTMLYSAKLYHKALEGKKFGIETSEVSFNYETLYKRKQKVVKKLVGGVGFKMKANKVDVIKAFANIKGKSGDAFNIESDGTDYQAKNIMISTGSEAFIPPIKGVDGVSDIILTNREILELQERPESLVIIGGGVIGMEFGCFFNTIGTKVTVIEMLPKILGPMDGELSSMLQKEYEKNGIEFHLESKVTEVKGNEVIFTDKDGKEQKVSADKILLSVGRKANVQGFGLENLGVEVERGGIKVDNKMRTNVPGVFAAGDVTGFSQLAHTAYREGEVVVNNLSGREDVMRYNAIPAVVYTDPEISAVGLTEDEAKKKGIEYDVKKLPMTYAGRFIVENEGFNGLCKVLVGKKYGEVLGVHMIGNPSSEMIYGACMAIETELTLKELEEVIFPHPTVSEIFRETVFAFGHK